MEAENREETERQLAIALILLWMTLDSRGWTGHTYKERLEFASLFKRDVYPIYAEIYGRGRATLAESLGKPYEVVTLPDGSKRVMIPRMDAAVMQHERAIFDSFAKRKERQELWEEHKRRWERAGNDPADLPKTITDRYGKRFNESHTLFDDVDAESIAITEVTATHSQAEMDAVQDVRRSGVRVDGQWVTERDERVCPVCGPLDGKWEKDWRPKFPNGSPAHFACRCYLRWVVIEMPVNRTTGFATRR